MAWQGAANPFTAQCRRLLAKVGEAKLEDGQEAPLASSLPQHAEASPDHPFLLLHGEEKQNSFQNCHRDPKLENFWAFTLFGNYFLGVGEGQRPWCLCNWCGCSYSQAMWKETSCPGCHFLDNCGKCFLQQSCKGAVWQLLQRWCCVFCKLQGAYLWCRRGDGFLQQPKPGGRHRQCFHLGQTIWDLCWVAGSWQHPSHQPETHVGSSDPFPQQPEDNHTYSMALQVKKKALHLVKPVLAPEHCSDQPS